MSNQIVGVLFAHDEGRNCSYLLPAHLFFSNVLVAASTLSSGATPNLAVAGAAKGLNDMDDRAVSPERAPVLVSPFGADIKFRRQAFEDNDSGIQLTNTASTRFSSDRDQVLSDQVMPSLRRNPIDTPGSVFSHTEQAFLEIDNEDWPSFHDFVLQSKEIVQTQPSKFFAAANKTTDEEEAFILIRHGVLIEMLKDFGTDILAELDNQTNDAERFLREYFERSDQLRPGQQGSFQS